jgi:hypothetical protein
MSKLCYQLHELVSQLPRHTFPFDKSRIPPNGIYILFEKGEQGHGADRIVRVGTSTGQGNLPSRLREHFMIENKDRSIFRKNIGRAILNRDRDPFLQHWDLDLTSHQNKDKYQHLIDNDKQRQVEHQVTVYIQDNFSFITIPVQSKDRRVQLEARIISTVSLCSACHSSGTWLGRHSPKPKIRQSGLWQVNKLYKQPLSPHDFDTLKQLLGGL